MSQNETRRRPPQFPQELLNRRHHRPRAVVAAEKKLNEDVDRAVGRSILDVTAALQQRLLEAIGLLDARRTADARALLHDQVAAIDKFETSILSQ